MGKSVGYFNIFFKKLSSLNYHVKAACLDKLFRSASNEKKSFYNYY